MIRLLALVLTLLFSISGHASVVYYLAAAPDSEIQTMAKDRERLGQFLFRQNPNGLYLDKAWHGVHWLLARNAGSNDKPASKIVMGGTEIGQNLGYGKARYFSPVEVKRIAKLLAAIAPADLKKNYDPAQMDLANVYPNDWTEWEKDGERPFEMLLAAFNDVKAFYLRAARDGHAVVYSWG